jgi:hypothetical protein
MGKRKETITEKEYGSEVFSFLKTLYYVCILMGKNLGEENYHVKRRQDQFGGMRAVYSVQG